MRSTWLDHNVPTPLLPAMGAASQEALGRGTTEEETRRAAAAQAWPAGEPDIR
jgi:hypothetical protein